MKIDAENDVYVIVQKVKAQALALGFDAFTASLLASAVSEITTNVVRYANHGVATLRQCDNGKGIEIQVVDCGTGIANVELAMQDGYSSAQSLGLGLGAAKRSVDEMKIVTASSGTTITLIKYLPVPREDIDTGMVSFPAVGEHFNGDAYFVKGYQGDKVLAAIFDGAGKGKKAAKSAHVIQQLLKKNYQLPLNELVHLGHKVLKEYTFTRGVELALLRITPETIESLVMGNVTIHANSIPYSSHPVQNGSLGLSIPEDIHVHQIKRPARFCFVMHSDGVQDIDYSSIFSIDMSAQCRAENIFDQHAITDDDATVVVLKSE